MVLRVKLFLGKCVAISGISAGHSALRILVHLYVGVQ